MIAYLFLLFPKCLITSHYFHRVQILEDTAASPSDARSLALTETLSCFSWPNLLESTTCRYYPNLKNLSDACDPRVLGSVGSFLDLMFEKLGHVNSALTCYRSVDEEARVT